MKLILFFTCIAFFMFQPLKTGTAQNSQQKPQPELVQPTPGQQQELIKNQITANLDTVATLLKSRAAEKKRVVTTKRRVRQKIIKDTVYIDTCLSEKEPEIITVPIHEQPETKLPPSPKKIKWYQKIFHKKLKLQERKPPAFF